MAPRRCHIQTCSQITPSAATYMDHSPPLSPLPVKTNLRSSILRPLNNTFMRFPAMPRITRPVLAHQTGTGELSVVLASGRAPTWWKRALKCHRWRPCPQDSKLNTGLMGARFSETGATRSVVRVLDQTHTQRQILCYHRREPMGYAGVRCRVISA